MRLAAKRRIMRSMRFILRVIALMLLAATSSLSQPRAKPASSAVDAGALDAGLGAPSSRVDAGAGPSEKAPAPPAPSAERLELDRLRLELTELRARTAALEQRAAAAEAVAARVERLGGRLEELRAHVTETESRQADAERRAVEQKANVEAVTRSLIQAQQTLATGATNIGEALRAAEVYYTGPALRDVQAARAALANGDLASARVFLGLAIIDAQSSRDP